MVNYLLMILQAVHLPFLMAVFLARCYQLLLLNQPQTAILGMHKIQDRPMAVKGEVVILPMMYLAISYDHRLIDGKEAVSFLVTIKDLVEDPALLLLDL
jgi:2-oxoglutarate dehydrogenase E2 component (dihydrolipoamide succinyltransferase)